MPPLRLLRKGGKKLEVPWSGTRCILCLKAAELTREHIIPEALGGRLWSRFLCHYCNSTVGSEVEGAARTDPLVRTAVSGLADQIPELAAQLTHKQAHLSYSRAGTAPGYVHNGRFIVHARKESDGSLVQTTEQARKTVQTILRRRGCDKGPILEAIERFDQAREDQKVEIHPGLEVVKWSIERIEPDITKSPPMNALVPLKMAFEFLACHLGAAIYDTSEQLDEIRRVLAEGDTESECIRVERLHAERNQAFHGLCFEGNKPCAQVQIRLFGRLAFRVYFVRLAVKGPRFIYTHYLDSNRECIRQLENESRA